MKQHKVKKKKSEEAYTYEQKDRADVIPTSPPKDARSKAQHLFNLLGKFVGSCKRSKRQARKALSVAINRL